MFSSHWPVEVVYAIKGIALLLGLVAAGFAWWAARLWLKASQVRMPEYDPPLASADDNPALHILSSDVRLIETTTALELSSRLNAGAAKWAAWAAMFTGITTILGTL